MLLILLAATPALAAEPTPPMLFGRDTARVQRRSGGYFETRKKSTNGVTWSRGTNGRSIEERIDGSRKLAMWTLDSSGAWHSSDGLTIGASQTGTYYVRSNGLAISSVELRGGKAIVRDARGREVNRIDIPR